MRLTIVNISSSVPKTDFHAAVKAIARQVSEDFGPAWNTTAVLRGTTHHIKGATKIDGIHDAILYLGASSQDGEGGVANALGYHAANYSQIPFGFVYLDVCEKYGEEWSTTLSHETLELLGDPSANLTVSGPPPKGVSHSVAYDLEVCDPTQGDSYVIDDVRVSNFVTPAYFGRGSGATNFLQLPLTAFGVRPRGYFQYEDGSNVQQVFGESVTKAIADARAAGRALLEKGGAPGGLLARRNDRRKKRAEQR